MTIAEVSKKYDINELLKENRITKKTNYRRCRKNALKI